MAQKKQAEKNEKALVLRSHDYKKLYVTNLIAGKTNYDFRVQVFNEKIRIEEEKRWAFVSDGLIIFTPQAAKKLSRDLQSYVSEFEKNNGAIDDVPRIDSDEEPFES